MVEHKLICEKLPILQRQYDGVFRTPLRPLKSLIRTDL
jgi:hypothetical protein